MKQYIVRRILISFFVLIGVSFILYALLRSMPGDFISIVTSGNPKVTEEMKIRLRELYGLDKGVLAGYVNWAKDALRGNLGNSFVYGKPVTEVIASKMGVTFSLSFVALIIQLAVAIPLGIVAATKQYTKLDYSIVAFALIGISLPSFFFSSVLQRIFAIGLGVLPLQGMVTARANYKGIELFFDLVRHFIMPVAVYAIISIGSWLRYTRTNMLEVLSADYVRTARAKGVPERQVIGKHAFRNTMIPLVTMLSMSLASLFAGGIITEGLFSIDGLGNVALHAVRNTDIPFLMGYNMFMAVMTLTATLLADILYAVVDPRVRYN